MGKTYGYARISRRSQSIERQIRNIREHYPDAIIIQEAYTGTKMDRPEWMKLLKTLSSGDTIVFDSVSVDKIDELMNQKLGFAFEELDQTVEKDFNFTLNVGFENMPKEGKKFTVMDIALK